MLNTRAETEGLDINMETEAVQGGEEPELCLQLAWFSSVGREPGMRPRQREQHLGHQSCLSVGGI